MFWVAQSKESHRLLGIFQNDEKAFDMYGDNPNVDIYWIESDF